MKRLAYLFGIILIVSIGMSSCHKNEPVVNNTEKGMNDLIISDDFDWKTTNDYKLTLTGKESNFVAVSSTDTDNITYQKAFLIANVPYTMKLTIPSYEKSITLYYMGQEIILELSNDNLSYKFE